MQCHPFRVGLEIRACPIIAIGHDDLSAFGENCCWYGSGFLVDDRVTRCMYFH
jgi:hypothetical protein